MNEKDLIKGLDFVTCVNGNFEEYGVSEGQLAFVAGHRSLPINEDDPYLQRIHFLIHPLNEDETINFTILLVVDGRSLAKVSEEEQERLTEKLREDTDSIN